MQLFQFLQPGPDVQQAIRVSVTYEAFKDVSLSSIHCWYVELKTAHLNVW